MPIELIKLIAFLEGTVEETAPKIRERASPNSAVFNSIESPFYNVEETTYESMLLHRTTIQFKHNGNVIGMRMRVIAKSDKLLAIVE